MNPTMAIETARKNNFDTKVKNELKYFQSGEKTSGPLTDCDVTGRIEMLEEILKGGELRKVDDGRGDLFKEIDKYVYKKQWNKLLAFHKIVKIKEYIKDTYGEGTMQDEIIMKLSECINDGKINTKKYVVYNPDGERILSMSCLDVDIKENKYKINLC
jgi:hypothetical protein